MSYSSKVLTRAEIEAEHGQVPPAISQNFTWRICRAHADVTWVTDDGGEHWAKKSVVWAEERNRRDLANLEQARIQRELK